MDNKVYVFEGKTSTEAIEKGLNELKVSKSKVDIKILESEDKRSFFSILTPRVVKVEIISKKLVRQEKIKKNKVKRRNFDFCSRKIIKLPVLPMLKALRACK